MARNTKVFYDFNGQMLEALVEIPESEPEPWGPDFPARVVGKPLDRVDAFDRVSGRARYTSDIALPGMLYGRILRCPYPSATLTSIDTSAAEKIPGVKVVLGPDSDLGGEIRSPLRKNARYAGQMVAAVAAETDAIAGDAIAAIETEWEELGFATTAEAASADDAPQIGRNKNRLQTRVYERGDAAAALEAADATIEIQVRTPTSVHASLETHGSVARWKDGELTVWDSTQSVFGVRSGLARYFQIPESKVRVITDYMGGGFGAKLGLHDNTRVAALLARAADAPVKLMLKRAGDFVSTGNRPESIQKVRAGAKKDGTLTALHLVAEGGVGVRGWISVSRLYKQLYLCPNIRCEETAVLTNAGPSAPFRAPGHPDGAVGLEIALDALADEIGMDPLEFRRKNWTDRNQENDTEYTSNHLREAYDLGSKAIGWEKRKPNGAAKGPRKRGLGMAAQLWGSGGRPGTPARCILHDDGSAEVMVGSQDIGTGTRSAVAMVAAEELGIPVDRITAHVGDTSKTPPGPGSGGSVTIPSITPAVRAAAADAKEKLLALAAEELGVEASDLSLDGAAVVGPGEKKVKIATLSKKAGGPIEGEGKRGPMKGNYTVNSHGAQFAEVEVDTETGHVKVLRIAAAHEAGRVINRKTFENQVEGGVVQGLAFGLLEERVLDPETGRQTNPNLHDYRLPTMGEIPEIEAIVIDRSDPKVSITGAKGLGEPPIIPTAAAIANAVANAIGVRVTELPITPERVLAALEKKAAAEKKEVK